MPNAILNPTENEINIVNERTLNYCMERARITH